MTGALAKPALKETAAIGAAAFAVLLYAAQVRPYGWFIDELYYLACARHLAFGYVDHPPLSIFLLAVVRAVFGDSLLAVRAVAAAALAANTVLVGLLARELGASRRAQCLSAVAFVSSVGFLTIASFFSMNVLEVLAWTAMALLAARALRRSEPRAFVGLGVVLGLALLNKHTAGTFIAALAAALLVTKQRKQLAKPWPWVALAVALVLVLPNVVWQWRHGWPSLEFYRSAQALKNVPTTPAAAVAAQAMMIGPLGFALAIVGAVSAVRADDFRRPLGLTFVLLFFAMIASGSSRPDRIAGAYPLALAQGAVALERFVSARRWPTWTAPAGGGALVASGVALSFVALPLLPPHAAAAYAQRLGAVPRLERKSDSTLPQWLADRLGWEAFVARVADVVATLPEDERARAVLFTPDYGHAGALELFGPKLGLGTVISNHNAYWMWSASVTDAPVLVAVDVSEARLRELYEDVRFVGTFHCDGCMPSRNDLPIAIARRPRVRLADAWPAMRHFE